MTKINQDGLEAILAGHPFFEGMTPAHLAAVADCATGVRFEAGEKIFHEGEEARNFYLISHGRVAIEIHAPQRGGLTVQTLEAGEILGWSWMIPPYQWRFDARAVGMVRAISLDGRSLREKCEADHDLGYELFRRMTRVIAGRLEATRVQLLDLYGHHV